MPLADNSILAIHWILSGAFDRGVNWNWIGKNPIEQADKPSMPKPDPQPPTAAETAQLINGAYAIDDDWGEFIFAKATTGNRRSEHFALQWRHFEDPPPPVDPDEEPEPAVVVVRQALYKADDGSLCLKDTKTTSSARRSLTTRRD
ncbi:hypothetical protein AB0L64_17565 [Kribbella sp. NPDC051936]|uniref:hypothetical protein n=1 Tax=Kribbella sp. NPDC051936 TaxID=3154946 RepID=UPI003421EE70